MKHKITVTTETKKHFLGIPYTVTEKTHITVDGKTYRKMKEEERCHRRCPEPDDELLAVAALTELEEEFDL